MHMKRNIWIFLGLFLTINAQALTVNIDGEGENVGNELHFVNHQNSLKIMKRDMKRALISRKTSEQLSLVRDQIQMTRDQLIPKKKTRKSAKQQWTDFLNQNPERIK